MRGDGTKNWKEKQKKISWEEINHRSMQEYPYHGERRMHSPIIVPPPTSLQEQTLVHCAGRLSNRPLGVKAEAVKASASIIAIHIQASTSALSAIHWRWIT